MSNAAVTFMVAAPKKRSRVRGALARYRRARRTLRTPASRQSRHGLDWTNFFIADLQTWFRDLCGLLPGQSWLVAGQCRIRSWAERICRRVRPNPGWRPG